MVDLIVEHRSEICALCRQYGIGRLEVFGSAARGDFRPGESDVDFFYEFDLSDLSGYADRFFGLKEDLEALLGVSVDLVSALDAKNPYFLASANRDRQLVYGI